MFRDYTYIVTGCTGYVGNVLTKKLLSEQCKVIGFARSPQKTARVFPHEKPHFVYGDIANAGDVEKLFIGEGPFVVIHTAAKVSIGEASSEELHKTTVQGTQNLIDASLRHPVEKFLHISSTEAIPHGVVLKEDLSNYIPEPSKTATTYAQSKSEADVAVLRAVQEHGLHASLLLLAGVLGPGDYSNSHMTQMMIEFIKGRLPASIDGGYNDFDIRDVADVLPAIVDNAKTGESYLFAHHPDKINDILSVISEMTGRKVPPTLPLWVAYVGLPFLYIGNKIQKKRPLYTKASLTSLRANSNFPIGKAQKEFGYAPRPLRETVTDHVNFLIENGMVEV